MNSKSQGGPIQPVDWRLAMYDYYTNVTLPSYLRKQSYRKPRYRYDYATGMWLLSSGHPGNIRWRLR